MKKIWKFAFYLVCAAVLLQAVLGEYFYKLYLTEACIVLAWLIVGSKYFLRSSVPYIGSLYILGLLSVGYFFYSLLLGRELYWVVRQGAFILYASVAIIGFKQLRYEPDTLARVSRHMFYFGSIMMAVQHFVVPVPGHPYFTAFLIFMLGTAYWVVQEQRVRQKVVITLVAFFVSLATNEHTTFLIVPFAILWSTLFIQIPKYRLFLGSVAGLTLAIIPLVATGLSDVNATWRYLYWLGVLQESWERGWFMIGKGFGTPYMPQSVEAFASLIDQVSGHENEDYQLMTVPPHNGLLTILIYVGLPGVVAFLFPYGQAARLALRKRMLYVDPTLLVAAFAFLLLLASNQFVEVPYTATLFWLVYGGMNSYIKQCQSARVVTPNYAVCDDGRRNESGSLMHFRSKH